MMIEEVWRDIPGYEGAYQVSNMGRVKSLPRSSPIRYPSGRMVARTLRERVLTPCVNKRGYESLVLRQDGKDRTHEVHRLVALAFIGPRKDGEETRHLDGNRLNNSASNLAYGTRSENQLDLYSYRGYHHKLRPEQVTEIRARREKGETCKSVAEEFGIAISTVSAIARREVYKWLA